MVIRSQSSRKTDKETQSPMLKIFKDMMQRDNQDPEKANLLKEGKEERRRKQYSGSRSKSDHVRSARSGDSSNVGRSNRSIHHQTQEQRNVEYDQCRTQSTPFQGDKKDSWWFWRETNKKSEDTCSCVSCALKKLAGSEYACVGCLLLIFFISVIIAFLLVFKSVPTLAAEQEAPKTMENLDSERLKRKIDYFKDKSNFEHDYATLKEDFQEGRAWDDTLKRQLNGLTKLSDLEFESPSFGEQNNPIDSWGISADLSKVLDDGKVAEFQNSERLRDFYKKLLQTDAQIKLLKKGLSDFTQFKTNNDLYLTPYRSKRSLEHPLNTMKNKTKHSIGKIKEISKDMNKKIINQKNIRKKILRNKRYDDNETEPNGFIIEKKKIVVQYQPSENKDGVNRKVAKCSHAPKDSKSHEKQLKHPFYKNTQRLDELLDQFLDKNLPEIMTDQFNLDLFKNENNQCKHPKTNQNIDINENDGEHQKFDKEKKGKDIRKMNSDQLNRLMKQDSTSMNIKGKSKHSFNNAEFEREAAEATTENFNVLLSISTILNPGVIKTRTYPTEDVVERVPNLRKLMQLEDEDENLGYEDVKEVLADDIETQDQTEKIGDRNKRDEIPDSETNEKYHPPRVHNPNWKGPMPLYPDEINSMIKQATLRANELGLLSIRNTANGKSEVPLKNKDISAEIDKAERDMNDMEYIEDYANDKFSKLVEMAQAYSDYGVLDEKRVGTNNEKNEDKVIDHKVKLFANKESSNRGFFGKSKKESNEVQNKNTSFGKIADPSEGLRFEVKPTSSTGREDNPMEVYKLLQKHLKISHSPEMKKPSVAALSHPLEADIDLMYTPTKYDNDKYHTWEHGKNKYGHKSDNPETGFIYTLSKGKRSLKSIEYDEQLDKYTSDVLNSSIDPNIMDTGDNHQSNRNNVHNIKFKSETLSYNNSTEIYGNNLAKNLSDNDFDKASSNFNRSIINQDGFINKTELSAEALNHNDIHDNGNYMDHIISNSFNNTANTKELNSTDTGMNLSDFFMFMSNLFSFMDFLDSSSPQNFTETFTNQSSNESDVVFPIYDSDMIENIGHRSRVLMSIDDQNITEKRETEDPNSKVGHYANLMDKTDADKISNNSHITTNINLNNASETEINSVTNEHYKQDNILENKTLVKRNAEDTSLIFWNDIYDDEYGVEVDPFENNIRDKHSVKRNNFIKSSSLWFRDKVKKLTNNLKKKLDKSDENDSNLKNKKNGNNHSKETDTKHRISRGVKINGPAPNSNEKFYNNIGKREIKIVKEQDTDPNNRDLESLKANMKDICRKAARAVQQTRNLEVREDTKGGAVASTLMQQLVRLMTDLVDYQVQQKTCQKLPPDLQNFLEWLVAPNERTSDSDFKAKFEDEDNMAPDIGNIDKSTEHYLDMMMRPTNDLEDLRPDDKPEAHGVLQAVTDLIHQYELITDDDKSKMSGIKEYLESQREFLQKQTSLNEFNTYQTQFYPMRFRRDLKYRRSGNHYAKHLRPKRRLSKFIKNFGKKHTKTTASTNDSVQNTEVSKNYKINPKMDDENLEKIRKSRNLRDIYYKAVADAKKITTSKNNMKSKK